MSSEPAASATGCVFVALREFAEHDPTPRRLLDDSGVRYRINPGRRLGPDDLVEMAADAVAVVAGSERYDDDVLARLPALRCIARCGTGVDNVDLGAAARRGVAVLNTPDVPTGAVAEHVMALTLALLRDLVRQADALKAGAWPRTETHVLLGRRVGLIGLGRIGRRVAELMRAFGATVHATDPRADIAWCRANSVTPLGFRECLVRAEVLCMLAAKDPRTPLRLGAAELALLPPGALVVNVARGGMIDEQALFDAIRAGRLGGAALDVFEEEPYSGPLRGLERVILTPHVASAPVETRILMETESVSKALRFLRGEVPPEEFVVRPRTP